MLKGLFGGGAFERIHFQQPPHEVQEELVITLETLLETCPFSYQDLNLGIFPLLTFVFLFTLLVNKSFFS